MTQSAAPALPPKAQNKAVRGTQLPKGSVKQAEELATQLWAFAKKASVSRESFSRHLNMSPTSSAFDTKVGLMRYFGLITAKDGNVQLSELGQDIVQTYDGVRQQEARRRALLSEEHFAKLLADYDGHEVPTEDTLATRMHFQHSLTEETARLAAKALIESVKYAGMLDDNGIVHLTSDEHGLADAIDSADVIGAVSDNSTVEGVVSQLQPASHPAQTSHVNINVTVNLAVDRDSMPELASLLRLLGFPRPDDGLDD